MQHTFSQQGRPFKVNPQVPQDSAPIPPSPKPKTTATDATKLEDGEILHAILPPRYGFHNLQCMTQQVQPILFCSSKPMSWQGMERWDPDMGAAGVQCTLYDD